MVSAFVLGKAFSSPGEVLFTLAALGCTSTHRSRSSLHTITGRESEKIE